MSIKLDNRSELLFQAPEAETRQTVDYRTLRASFYVTSKDWAPSDSKQSSPIIRKVLAIVTLRQAGKKLFPARVQARPMPDNLMI